jgi:hypothetical protein
LYLKTGQKEDFNRVLKSFGVKVSSLSDYRRSATILFDISSRFGKAKSYQLSREFAERSVDTMKKEADACRAKLSTSGHVQALHDCVRLAQTAGLPAAKVVPLLYALSIEYKALGRLNKAEQLALSVIRLASEPPQDLQNQQTVLFAKHHLAEIYLCQGKVGPAISLLEDNVAMGARVYGKSSAFCIGESKKLAETRLESRQMQPAVTPGT